jgi:hydroxyacylglutathione hydrolase
MILESAAVGPFFKNGFVVGCERTRQAVFIDPGDEVDQLLAFIAAEQLSVTHILLTHAHVDHVSGVAEAKRTLGAPVYLHKDDLFLYQNAVRSGMMFGLTVEEPPPHLFVGDTLFAGSIGRTDLPGGDYQTLLKAITEVLFTFPDESIVYSGHGPETTIGREKATNPFVLEYLSARR